MLACEAAAPEFHARFSAREKCYRYQLYVGSLLPPMLYGRAWRIPQPLQQSALREAAEILQGRHDFRCFAANRGGKASAPHSTIRTIKSINIDQSVESNLLITFCGDGFMYRMVRMLVATMIRYARGELSREGLQALADARSESKTSACAPADGLYLESVCYDEPEESVQ